PAARGGAGGLAGGVAGEGSDGLLRCHNGRAAVAVAGVGFCEPRSWRSLYKTSPAPAGNPVICARPGRMSDGRECTSRAQVRCTVGHVAGDGDGPNVNRWQRRVSLVVAEGYGPSGYDLAV